VAAGERLLRRCAFALAALGLVALLVVRPDTAPAATGPRQAIEVVTTTTTAQAFPVSSTTTVGTEHVTSTSVSAPAVARTNVCGSVTKHGAPQPDDRFYEGDQQPRRSVGSGTYLHYAWRLLFEPFRPDTKQIALDFEYKDLQAAHQGDGGSPYDGEEFGVNGHNIGNKDGWAWFGPAPANTACVVVNSSSGTFATDELYSDSAYPDRRFWVNIVPHADLHNATTVDWIDAAGHAIHHEDLEPFPADFVDG
jgi:hypothetical protein